MIETFSTSVHCGQDAFEGFEIATRTGKDALLCVKDADPVFSIAIQNGSDLVGSVSTEIEDVRDAPESA